MLIGFTIVAAPLLFAIVNAAVQMNRLSTRSEQLVVHGVQRHPQQSAHVRGDRRARAHRAAVPDHRQRRICSMCMRATTTA